MAGAHDRLIREQNERAWLAWHVAALPKARKFPSLKSMLIKQPGKKQTWQEIQAIMGQWVIKTRNLKSDGKRGRRRT